MISITCMLIISTIQSSIDKMVPKTSYLKLVDVFLLYSFNIVIIIMAIHTYMDMCIHRDETSGRIVDKERTRPSSRSRIICLNHITFFFRCNKGWAAVHRWIRSPVSTVQCKECCEQHVCRQQWWWWLGWRYWCVCKSKEDQPVRTGHIKKNIIW